MMKSLWDFPLRERIELLKVNEMDLQSILLLDGVISTNPTVPAVVL
jgi:hypothetical protein